MIAAGLDERVKSDNKRGVTVRVMLKAESSRITKEESHVEKEMSLDQSWTEGKREVG